MRDANICTLVYEPDGGGQALYDPDGNKLDGTYDEAIDPHDATQLHDCRMWAIRQADIENEALWQDCRTTRDGETVCDFGWPPELDEAWLVEVVS